MFKLNENEKEFRDGDSGPKYLLKGPRMNFGLLQLQPGQVFAPHYHKQMEEIFFVLEGEVTFTVNQETFSARSGDFVHCEPMERHGMQNSGEGIAKITFCMSPSIADDKFTEELP